MGAWEQIAALPTRLERAAAVYHEVTDRVYIFAGYGPNNGPSVATFMYTPSANTWTPRTPIPAAMGTPKAFVAPDNKIHLLNGNQHFRYDPTSDAWENRALPPNFSAEAATLAFQDTLGRIHLYTSQDPSLHRYDPTNDAWTRLATAGPNESQHNTVGVLGDDGKFYTGYQTFCDDLVIYDPATNTWARTPKMPAVSAGISWTSGGYNVPVSRLPNGLILALPSNWGSTAWRRVDGYNPASGLWEQGVIPDFPGRVWDYRAVATDPAGRVWLIGGEDNSGASSSSDNSKADAWVYLQNRPPLAPTLRTLVDNELVSTQATNRAAHTFHDPDAGDSQSQFELRYRLVGDVTWTTVLRTTPNPWWDIPAGTLDPGDYERQVRTWDAEGLPGPWSLSGFFTADTPPDGPTITYPINGQDLEQTETITWSVPNQDAFQVRRVADNAGAPDTSTVYYDSGEVTNSVLRSLQLTFETNARPEHVQVRIKHDGLWSDWVSVRVNVGYTPPAAPIVALYTDEATGSLLVMITNPAPTGGEPAASYNEVWVNDGDGWERRATELPTSSSWRYWTPVSGRDYSTALRVVAVAANGTTSSSL